MVRVGLGTPVLLVDPQIVQDALDRHHRTTTIPYAWMEDYILWRARVEHEQMLLAMFRHPVTCLRDLISPW